MTAAGAPDPVRWGVLGAGWITDAAMAPAIAAADGASLHAIAARDPARAAGYAERHGIARVHRRYADLLADPDVDAVYLALPNDGHRPWAVAALDAGKHVLCEKPLALSAREVDEMAAAAQRNGVLLAEASWYRWHPRVQLAQRLLGEGVIGTVRHVAAGFTFAGVRPGNYRLAPERGGGAAYDVGCYAVSAALWAFAAPPREVAARLVPGPTGVDLTCDLIVSFDGGDAEVHASMDEPPRQWLVVTGDRGELELREQPFTAWLGLDTELWLSSGRGTERLPIPAADPYRLMVEQFSAVARGGSGWVLPVAESRATAAVLDAAFAAAASGAPVGVAD